MEKNNLLPIVDGGTVAMEDNIGNDKVEEAFDVVEAVKTLTVVVNKALQEIVVRF
jgi:hypothetical protein